MSASSSTFDCDLLIVGGGVNGAGHPLQFKLLAKAQGERFGHGVLRRGWNCSQHYKVFQLAT